MTTRVGLNQAARMAGKAKTTLLRHVKAGKLSAIIADDGRKRFDVAELERVYGTLATGDTGSETPVAKPSATGSRATTSPRPHAQTGTGLDPVALLADQVESLKAELVRLRSDLEKERDERRLWADRYHKLAETIPKLEGPVTSEAEPTTTRAAGRFKRAAHRAALETREFLSLFRDDYDKRH